MVNKGLKKEVTVNQLLPQLKIICIQWNLKINKLKDFNIAKRILINSVNKN